MGYPAAPDLDSIWLTGQPLIALLLKQLVLFGDWEDTADEVKQLDPVWSSKRRHTGERHEGGGESCAEHERTRDRGHREMAVG